MCYSGRVRALGQILITLLVIIYSPNEKTAKIIVYDYSENGIEMSCAEGVSYSECQAPTFPKEKEKVESVSYDEIINFVMKGPYQF